MAMKNGHDDPKVTSLDEARRKAAAKAKADKGAGKPGAAGGGRASLRDWLIGGTIIAMAVGLVASFLLPLFGGR
jgi:hypothetical protein